MAHPKNAVWEDSTMIWATLTHILLPPGGHSLIVTLYISRSYYKENENIPCDKNTTITRSSFDENISSLAALQPFSPSMKHEAT